MKTDQAHWDSQLKFSQILPDFADHLATLENRSKDYFAANPMPKTPYGADVRQWFEASLDPTSPDRAVVFVHGGYWRALRAEDHRACLMGLAQLSPSIVNLEYRLIPSVTMNAQIGDIRAGLTGLLAQLPVNAKLVLVGHSAGAHLALSAAQDPDLTARIEGVVAISGIYDLAPIRHSFLQAELSLTEAETRAHSIARAATGLPVLSVVGGDETELYHAQAQAFCDGNTSPLLTVQNTHHMSILGGLMAPDTPLLHEIERWLSGQNPASQI